MQTAVHLASSWQWETLECRNEQSYRMMLAACFVVLPPRPLPSPLLEGHPRPRFPPQKLHAAARLLADSSLSSAQTLSQADESGAQSVGVVDDGTGWKLCRATSLRPARTAYFQKLTRVIPDAPKRAVRALRISASSPSSSLLMMLAREFTAGTVEQDEYSDIISQIVDASYRSTT